MPPLWKIGKLSRFGDWTQSVSNKQNLQQRECVPAEYEFLECYRSVQFIDKFSNDAGIWALRSLGATIVKRYRSQEIDWFNQWILAQMQSNHFEIELIQLERWVIIIAI